MDKNQEVRTMLRNVIFVRWVYIWDGIDDYRLDIYDGKNSIHSKKRQNTYQEKYPPA